MIMKCYILAVQLPDDILLQGHIFKPDYGFTRGNIFATETSEESVRQ